MATSLNPGFRNNRNVVVVRTQGTACQKLTDRAIDLDGDGVKEGVTITLTSGHGVGTPAAPGGVTRQVIVTNRGFKNTVVQQVQDTDGGVANENLGPNSAQEFTDGVS